jgi:segregation and condensation protein A
LSFLTQSRPEDPYQVKLAVFEGPLDLLLHLIEREKLDITRVSLAQVTDQYLEYISLLKEVSAAALANFLVIAAKLLFIKSQVLLPKPSQTTEEPEEDVGEELARQLIEYRRFKRAAQKLKAREEQGRRTYLRLAPAPRLEGTLELESIPVLALAEAIRRVLEIYPSELSVADVVLPFTVTIADKIALIEETMARYGRFSFDRLLTGVTSRLEIIVTLLAVLELLKRHQIEVHQERLFGAIFIAPKPQSP